MSEAEQIRKSIEIAAKTNEHLRAMANEFGEGEVGELVALGVMVLVACCHGVRKMHWQDWMALAIDARVTAEREMFAQKRKDMH